jgi:hypothetical protein
MWDRVGPPHADWHIGPIGQPLLCTSVPHRLLGCIYAVLQVGLIQGLTLDALAYIYSLVPPPWSHPKTLIHIL